MRVLIKGAWSLWLILQLVRADEYECPEMCVCKASDVSADCQNNGLKDLPQGIYSEVLRLDLAFNDFTSIPTSISTFKVLQYLNMSHNKLSFLGSDTLGGLSALEVLDLSHNSFKDWINIHTDALMSVPALVELDLSYNPLRGFPDVMIEYPLKSSSLRKLLLVNCSINNMLGDILLGLTNVQTLILTNNPLVALNTQIKSEKLQTLDLTQCNLQRIQSEAFTELASLENLVLSRNYQLKKFNSRSDSLRYLDLSHCNLESVPITSLPNLTKASFKGNHLRRVPANSFQPFPSIQWLDLSNNAIERVDVKAFHGLRHVQAIDLSFNTLAHVAPETFVANPKLHKLNLSRNYLSEVGQLVAESLRHLDLSVCEIRELSRDSLIMMPKLQRLNLSRNLISHVPNRLQGDELRALDLSMCLIYGLTNQTFASTSRLRSLNLAGNRLTSGVKPAFFYGVTDLRLDDNPWLCDCSSQDFQELHEWLYSVMSSEYSLRCRTPETVAGLTWETVCQDVWFSREAARADGMWVYSVSLVAFMSLLCCVVISIRHFYHRKALREREIQEREREEARERLRQIHQRNLQYSRESVNRNAPDPRELQTPPSYAEAVSMPRLNVSCSSLAGSHRSLHSLHSSHPDLSRRTKLRRKRRRGRNDKYSVSETQSTASLSHANSEASNSEDEFRPSAAANRDAFIESSF